VLAFFQKLPPCLVGIEACASSHHWSRELQALGHTVRLRETDVTTTCQICARAIKAGNGLIARSCAWALRAVGRHQ
jgi:DNA alkylation repair enzyme